MDKILASEAGDYRFDSCRAHYAKCGYKDAKRPTTNLYYFKTTLSVDYCVSFIWNRYKLVIFPIFDFLVK